MSRQILRSLVRAPAFSLTAILTVALGIGVNAAIFSVIYTVLLAPLPYREPARLVRISETHPEFPSLQVAAPDYADWRRAARSFSGIAGYTFQAMNQATLLGQGEPERVQVTQAAHELFPMLGMEPLYGRAFTAEEEARQAPVVLLSEALWRRRFAGDPGVVGRTIRLEHTAFTVVGIVSARQAMPSWADLWMPLSLMEAQLQQVRRFHPLEVVARLKPGVTVEQAQAEMRTVAANLARSYPATNNTIGAAVLPLDASITGEVRPSLLMAWAAVSLVLLLACANVAHLVMIRAVSRSQEMAVRAALGANTWQLMRLMAAESGVIAAAGGAVGLVLAGAALPLVGRFAAGDIPRADAVAFTAVTPVAAAAAAVVCGLLFAIPALFHARSMQIHQTIRQSAGISAMHRRGWFGASIIAAEVALAFVVMAGAGLLYRSFEGLLREDTGFDARGVIAVEVPLSVDWTQSAKVFEQQLAPRLAQIPGVTSVAAANCAPMTLRPTETTRFATRFGVKGRTFEAGRFPVAQLRWVTPEYFRALRIPLRAGRLLTAADEGKPGYVINETLARRFFPGQDPVGRELLMDVVSPNPQPVPILGVVGDVRDLGLDVEPRPTLYSLGVSPRMTLLVAAKASPAAVIPALREAIRAVAPEAPVTRVAPLETVVEASLARRRFALYLLSAFAGLAGLLTVIGVYGVIAYSVSRRGREFAIRFAVGARPGDLRRLVIRGFAVPAGVGLALGVWLAYLFAGAMRTQLYRTSPWDWRVMAATVAMLAALVLAAALRPARKAAAVSPTAALRE